MEIHIQAKRILLIKFQSSENIKKFQQGKMYMKSLEWYRNNAKITAVGDDYEAMLHINQATMRILQTNELVDIDDDLIPTTHGKDFVFCMFCIPAHTSKFTFTEEQKSEMLSFGDTALIITDSEEFCIRVRSAMKKEDIDLQNVYHGQVKYYDEAVDLLRVLKSLMSGMHNVAFQKRKKYAYQKEYRILVPYDNRADDFLELDIGDISDISEIVSSETLLKSLVKKVESKQKERANGQT